MGQRARQVLGGLLGLVLLAATASARTMYTTDTFEIVVRSEKQIAGRNIIKVLPSGVPLEVRDMDDTWATVRLEDGRTGYVEKKYLIDREPYKTTAERLQGEVGQQRERLATLTQQLATVRDAHQRLPQAHGMSKYFGPVPAVQELSCTIAQGEFLALLGPSGCGKTTTLLMLAGIYRPSSGVLRFDGRIVNDVPPRQRNIGMVFQSYALYPHLTVFENLAFPLRVQRQARAVIPRKVEEIAALVQLQDLLQRKPAQLSGGQQQRVALGRALIKEPDVLLFDEPLSNLDAELRLHMRAEIRHLHRSLGLTTVLVTHDQAAAISMTIIIM